MSYYTTLTNAALTKISAALTNGTTLTMSEMAVGDGNGLPTNPAPENTALVNEVYRAPVNQLTTNQDGYLVAEMVIPVSNGGYTVREIALYDSDGDLFAIGSLPAIVKPVITDNALGELVLRMIIAIDNVATINLTVDTSLVTATQQWVEANYSPAALFPGGTTGQILAKNSNLDGDTLWKDPTSVNVVVDTIEETQTLAASQTIVTLTTVTTTGLAIYIEGVRIPRSAWTANTATQITLAESYPAGTIITMVQNEPASKIESVPVGMTIMLGLSTTPAQLLGYGVWSRVAEGQAIFGYSASDADHNTIGKTGGSKTHSHTGSTNVAGSHSHSGATGLGGEHNHSGFTGSAGSHNHIVSRDNWGESPLNGPISSPSTASVSGRLVTGSGNTEIGEDLESLTHASADQSTSSVSAHSHAIQGSGTHTHSISSDGSHSHTVTTNTASSLPPYYTIALWLRTA